MEVAKLCIQRFYGGARSRVSSFSCTNATIKKFKDALGKHGAEGCSLGPAKGFEESELLSLASNKGSNFSYPLRSLLPGDFSFYSDFEGRTDMAMASLH
ncbi:thioredoxin-like 1-1, chloroplastic isoform X2 [Asparagus officinalis]|uniref:thioredoxin-like 1-1, chloroplastic isoform X2 n=1 Tax=Asparagus officinalis TaxID=4686 RepID=UPI00098E04EF|nr:thioredoxin-like 1-1, chloroplastic isoform X2 [Asparagus officinalis]